MIPATGNQLQADFTFQEGSSRTFGLQIEQGRFLGYVDRLEAMRQAVYLILNVERYRYIIYSWNYGVELADLFGQPIPFVLPELERRISEALLADSRILRVEEFQFEVKGQKVLCTFQVVTIYGNITAEKEVDI